MIDVFLFYLSNSATGKEEVVLDCAYDRPCSIEACSVWQSCLLSTSPRGPTGVFLIRTWRDWLESTLISLSSHGPPCQNKTRLICAWKWAIGVIAVLFVSQNETRLIRGKRFISFLSDRLHESHWWCQQCTMCDVYLHLDRVCMLTTSCSASAFSRYVVAETEGVTLRTQV